MTDYYDSHAAAMAVHERQLRRRQQMEAALRGWARTHRWPRLMTLLLLIGAAVPALAFVWWARRTGLGPGLCAFYGVLIAWPIFLCLLHWWTHSVWQGMDVAGFDFQRYLGLNELAEQRDQLAGSSDSIARRFIDEGLSRTIGEATGQGGIFSLLLIGSLTAGLWVIWQLIRSGADLLARGLIDGVLIPRQPKLGLTIPSTTWTRSAIEGTAMHFAILAASATIFTGTLSLCLTKR